MTDQLDLADHLDFTGPDGLRTRGTVLVVPGRGESPGSYLRFGSRIAADAYRVRVVAPPDLDPADIPGSLARLADALAAAVPLVEEAPVRPLVLVGSDSGGAALAALVAQVDRTTAWWPDALVLAGLPGHGARANGGWDEELDARTHCPVHRGVLSHDAGVRRGTLTDPVPDRLLDLAYGTTVDLPHLLLVGDADPFANHEALARVVKTRPRARLAVVHGAHHDVLNDLQHRSVAAEVVSFLEALRTDPSLAPLVQVETSAW
jgi:alpha-beta hydrolase superfamily lysophospholipase